MARKAEIYVCKAMSAIHGLPNDLWTRSASVVNSSAPVPSVPHQHACVRRN